jgi:hypothetical protein
MRQLYGDVPNFNFEEEYGIIARTIEHEREVLQESPKFIHVVQGLNLVSPFVLFNVGETWAK